MSPASLRTLLTVYSTVSLIVGLTTPACAIACLVLVRRTNRALAALAARLDDASFRAALPDKWNQGGGERS